MEYKLEDLEEKYELELDRVLSEIEKSGAKKVLLQLPDGLKPWGVVLCDYISEKSGVDVRIYLGDCFGACDLPETDCDLVFQFGHADW
jgi:diphthamide biosynthesis enzyme Dph1/Dph2-like protein